MQGLVDYGDSDDEAQEAPQAPVARPTNQQAASAPQAAQAGRIALPDPRALLSGPLPSAAELLGDGGPPRCAGQSVE